VERLQNTEPMSVISENFECMQLLRPNMFAGCRAVLKKAYLLLQV
jgi:hypothetical protein